MNPIDYWYQKYLKKKLTADDVQLICEIEQKLWWEKAQEIIENGLDAAFYEEVLKRFNEQKRNETD